MNLSVRRLISGLGNVGKEYAGTRHNIGFALCNLFCYEYLDRMYCRPSFSELKENKYFKGKYFETEVEFLQDTSLGLDYVDNVSQRAKEKTLKEGVPYKNVQLGILLPSTYMNRSGNAIRSYVDSKSFLLKSPTAIGSKDEILIIHDDIDLPFGKIQLSPKGSSAGQNGVKNIISRLGTEKFVRLRIGINRSDGTMISHGNELVNHVIGKWNGQEKEELPYILHQACEVLRVYLFRGFQTACTFSNGKNCIESYKTYKPDKHYSYSDIQKYL
ncbi:hypothetical protein WA158_007566 [Blastocystis sp. Blastoise]